MVEFRHAAICILVFLAVSAQCGLSSSTEDNQKVAGEGWVQFFNSMTDSPTQVWFQNVETYDNLDQGVESDHSFPSGTTWFFSADQDLSTLETTFHMSNATGNYKQDVLTFTREPTGQLIVPCAPGCSWTLDHLGFSLASLAIGGLKFVAGWIGPL